jgi:hypothetical protein
MKLLLTVMMIFWVICGFAGECMLDGIGDLRWKGVARGPLTLVEAFNDDPVTLPTGR